MTGLIQLALACICLMLLRWAWRQRFQLLEPSQRLCPNCSRELEPLTPGPDPEQSYELLACPACSFAEATVHGVRSPLAYCSACHQRSMHLVLSREGAVVTVVESCHLCGHQGRRSLAMEPEVAPVRDGKVIPFPTHRGDPK